MYEIQKGVPIPDVVINHTPGRARKYPLGDMLVGDCFFLETRNYARVASAISQFTKRHDKIFTIRTLGAKTGVWRVA